MRRVKQVGRIILYVLGSFLLLFLILMGYLIWVSRVTPPKPANTQSEAWQRANPSPGFYTLKNSWLRESHSGLYEMYVEGQPFERGVVNGKLSKELIQKQEEYFNDQIRKMIPGKFYLHFLKYFVGWFNRHLDQNVNEEYKEEIYGISQSASHDYDYIGSNYQRILNYHAAHDIGHALQNLALVGCTSFGTWNGESADSTMIIGRNFDFYAGDHFSENKIVAFINPSEGYKFMSVTWGGFIGVVSGMNEKGLTVTINAAKSTIPSGSATPVSLVAREILQYAQNINEAVAIARKRKMFVSESFLVASAEDNRAVTIEKTPDSLSVYDPKQNFIVCTNHFQSQGLASTASNKKQIRESASAYRYDRLMELLKKNGPNTVQKTVNILRDREGLHDQDIGLGNEKAINQLMAHHSIVFEPQKLLVWVSTSPWQLGQYIAYDLKKVFAKKGMQQNEEVCESSLTIAADSFLLTDAYKNFERFRTYKQRIAAGQWVDPDSLIRSNPNYYHTYVLAGDEYFRANRYEDSAPYYEEALSKTIATKPEEIYIRKQLAICSAKSKAH